MIGLATYVKSLRRDEAGQTMVEYGLILVLFTLVVITAVPAIADAVMNLYNEVAGAF
jgi:Flp pilus assembly pilin Flp